MVAGMVMRRIGVSGLDKEVDAVKCNSDESLNSHETSQSLNAKNPARLLGLDSVSNSGVARLIENAQEGLPYAAWSCC